MEQYMRLSRHMDIITSTMKMTWHYLTSLVLQEAQEITIYSKSFPRITKASIQTNLLLD